MALEDLRGYFTLISGLTEVSRQRAVAQAKALLADGSLDPVVDVGRQAGNQVQVLADDILATARANRDLLMGIARTEAERVVSPLGLAGGDEVAALQAQVDRLTRRVTQLEGAGAGPGPAKKTTAKKTAAKKATTRKSTTTKPTAAKSASTGASS